MERIINDYQIRNPNLRSGVKAVKLATYDLLNAYGEIPDLMTGLPTVTLDYRKCESLYKPVGVTKFLNEQYGGRAVSLDDIYVHFNRLRMNALPSRFFDPTDRGFDLVFIVSPKEFISELERERLEKPMSGIVFPDQELVYSRVVVFLPYSIPPTFGISRYDYHQWVGFEKQFGKQYLSLNLNTEPVSGEVNPQLLQDVAQEIQKAARAHTLSEESCVGVKYEIKDLPDFPPLPPGMRYVFNKDRTDVLYIVKDSDSAI